MTTFEITVYRAAINDRITLDEAKVIINEAIKANTTDMYNKVVDRYVKLIRSHKHDRSTVKNSSRTKC
jgi:TRAP-type mannitol/chloroaromatic compound transport system substrate-binding protein